MSDRATIYGTMAGGTIIGVIYDDTAAAVPEENPAGYDLDTCDRKHGRMTAYQAQRIDALEAHASKLEAEVDRLHQTIRVMSVDIGRLLHLITTDKIPARMAAMEQTIREWSAGK